MARGHQGQDGAALVQDGAHVRALGEPTVHSSAHPEGPHTSQARPLLPGDASKGPDVLRQAALALHQARGATRPPGPRLPRGRNCGDQAGVRAREAVAPLSGPHPRPARLLTRAPSRDTSPRSPRTATGRLEHIRGCTATPATPAGRAGGPLTWTRRPSPLTHTGAPRPAPLQLTGLPSRQLQLSLVGAASVGPRADHLAADGLLAHQRGRAVRIPQAGMAGAPTAL